MEPQKIILDHIEGIFIDLSNPPFGNYQAFRVNYDGLNQLALVVREMERKYIAENLGDEGISFNAFMSVPSIVPCAFDWFSVTLVNYLRLVALVQLMNSKGWNSNALTEPKNRSEIKNHCKCYIKTVAPEVLLWRDKVAAHFAATDPRSDDNLGTLEQSVMGMVEFMSPYYYVGAGKWVRSNQISELPEWSLTKIYEELAPRLWPEIQLPKAKP